MRKNRVKRTCETCGSAFELPASRATREGTGRYCSRPCRRRPEADRFWEKVNKNGPVPSHRPDLGPCWLWTGALDQNGYGEIWSAELKRPVKAQRMAWKIGSGTVPTGLEVMHLCDNPPCIRLSHLTVGMSRDNVRDMLNKKRHGRARLSTEDVQAIRSRAAAGERITSIAADYPSCYSAVRRAARGKAWAHVA